MQLDSDLWSSTLCLFMVSLTRGTKRAGLLSHMSPGNDVVKLCQLWVVRLLQLAMRKVSTDHVVTQCRPAVHI